MMIRRCAICRKREEAYKMLRIYVDQNNTIHLQSQSFYKPSIRVDSELLYQNPKKGTKLFTWICIKTSCIGAVCKKTPKFMLGKIFQPKIQIFDIFAKGTSSIYESFIQTGR